MTNHLLEIINFHRKVSVNRESHFGAAVVLSANRMTVVSNLCPEQIFGPKVSFLLVYIGTIIITEETFIIYRKMTKYARKVGLGNSERFVKLEHLLKHPIMSYRNIGNIRNMKEQGYFNEKMRSLMYVCGY